MKLEGGTFWITGASSGIGEGVAYELAKLRTKLILSGRNAEALARVADRCQSLGAATRIEAFDLTDYERMQAAVDSVLADDVKIDGLMNFGGISQRSLAVETPVSIDRKVMTVCIGSGPGYGQTPNAVPYNGMLDVSVVYHPEVVQLIEGLWLLITGRFLNHRSVHPYRTQEVRVDEARHAMVGIDGRLMKTPVGPFRVDVEQEVINFLIPA